MRDIAHMTDLDQYIMSVVEDKAPIKGVDLAVEIAKHQHGVTETDITQSLGRLAAAGLIQEIEYVLPKMSYRVKSIYFPEGTKLKVISQ